MGLNPADSSLAEEQLVQALYAPFQHHLNAITTTTTTTTTTNATTAGVVGVAGLGEELPGATRVLLLLRDPRGILNSRLRVEGFCKHRLGVTAVSCAEEVCATLKGVLAVVQRVHRATAKKLRRFSSLALSSPSSSSSSSSSSSDSSSLMMASSLSSSIFLRVRYEDMCSHPVKVMRGIYRWAEQRPAAIPAGPFGEAAEGQQTEEGDERAEETHGQREGYSSGDYVSKPSPETERWLRKTTHASMTERMAYNVRRNASALAHLWRQQLSAEHARLVSAHCSGPLRQLGYEGRGSSNGTAA